MDSFPTKLLAARLLGSGLCLLAIASPAAAYDLSGHWRVGNAEATPATFATLGQTGDVFYSLDGPFPALSGSITGDRLRIAAPWPFASPFEGRVLAGGNIISGEIAGQGWITSRTSLLLTRCECFDGNSVDGDGCDAQCRIEPCFTCSGDPSTCVASADGEACDDRRDCSQGETCTAGACGGGSPVPSCIDMTGRWRITTVQDRPGHLLDDLRDVEQEDGVVVFRRVRDGFLEEVGTVDLQTGALELVTGHAEGDFMAASNLWTYDPIFPFPWSANQALSSCGPVDFTGHVSDDGSSFTGAGSATYAAPQYISTHTLPGCGGPSSFTQSATRCRDGECASPPDECALCETRLADGLCHRAPRPDCRRSVDPSRSMFSLSNLDPGNAKKRRFLWSWKAGEALDAQDLGDLGQYGGVAICVFEEEAGADPVLRMTTFFDATLRSSDEPVWEAKGDGLTYVGAPAITSFPRTQDRVEFHPGAAGEASFVARGMESLRTESVLNRASDVLNLALTGEEYPGFPSPPFVLPLRVQAQVAHGGTCWESTFDSFGVQRNGRQRFSAHASR